MKDIMFQLDRKTSLILLLILFLIFGSNTTLAAFSVAVSDQGTGAKRTATGQLIELGNLTVRIFDQKTGGNLIYTEFFENKIINGSWNLMLGEDPGNPLALEYGKKYYKDYYINGEDAFFMNNSGGMTERQRFFSPLGDINTSDISDESINESKLKESINLSNATGYRWSMLKEVPENVFHIETDYYNKTATDSKYLNKNNDNSFFSGAFNLSTTGNITSFFAWITSVLKIPFGSSPTVDSGGEIAIDSTEDQLVYFGSAKRVIPYYEEKCFTLETPVEEDDNIPLWSPRSEVEVIEMFCRNEGGAWIEVTLGNTSHNLDVMNCTPQGTSDDGTIGNSTLKADEKVKFDIGTISGTVEWVNFCFTYTVTPK